MPRFKSIDFYLNTTKISKYFQNKNYFLEKIHNFPAAGSLPLDSQWLPAAGGSAIRPPKQLPPIADFWLRVCCTYEKMKIKFHDSYPRIWPTVLLLWSLLGERFLALIKQ